METAEPPAKQEKATQDGTPRYEHMCPYCNETVRSVVRTGQVDHRRKCGCRFSVTDGHVAAKTYVYVCPCCNGEVRSNMKTGQINHTTVCNNKFYVKNGQVSAGTRRHAHACPVCQTLVWSARAFGRIQSVRETRAGQPCKKKAWHVPQGPASVRKPAKEVKSQTNKLERRKK